MLSKAEIERRLTLDPEGFVPPISPGERVALETCQRLGEWGAEWISDDPMEDNHCTAAEWESADCECSYCLARRAFCAWHAGESGGG